jgi:glycosyltransferase involved in cell wall biosynthesis
MNILFVHETEYIDKMIFEYQIIPEILSSRGHNIFVIDFPTKWIRATGSLFHKRRLFPDIRSAHKSKGITLLRPGFIMVPVLSRISAFFSYFNLIEQTILTYNIECIVLYAAPTNGIQTLWNAKKYHIPVYFRLLDILHLLVPSNILRYPALLIEEYVYRRVEKLTAISHKLLNYAISIGADPQKCSYLPTGSDNDLFYFRPKKKGLLDEQGLTEDDLLLVFAGTLYDFSGLGWVIRGFLHYLKIIPKLKLLIVGSGEQESFLRSEISRLGLEKHIKMAGFINYLDLPDYINLGDICINLFELTDVTRNIIPSKIYQYLACGKPVVATKLPGMMDIFPEGSSKGVFYISNPGEFIDLIKQIGKQKISSNNPSLQEISGIIENDLSVLIGISNGNVEK